MKVSRLKTFALVIWMGILAAGVLLAVLVFNVNRLPAAPEENPQGLTPVPSPSHAFPTWTFTPARPIIYLPSATARPVSPTATQPSPTPITPFPTTAPQFYAVQDGDPLTGTYPAADELLDRRPVAVKITNFPRSVRAYQSGLSRADVAFEYYIEDGLTRFIAVFYGQDAERAGPVRSGRYFDEHIMRMYHSSLVFANADERVEKYLYESDLHSLLFIPRDDYCPPLCRDTNIKGYNNVFVNTAGVGPKLSDNSRQDLRLTNFGPLLRPENYPAIYKISNHYSIYSYNYWEYDPGLQLYRRYSDAGEASAFTVDEIYQPHIDHLTGEQLTTQNVVELIVPHNFNNEYDRADQVFNITLTGNGPAYIFREGRMILGAWLRDRLDQPILLIDDQGHPIALQPGVTFYQVINPASTISTGDEEIDFNFYTPLRHVTLTPTPIGYDPTPTPKKK